MTTFATDPAFEPALDAAKEAAEATAYLDAKAGRAAYVDQKALKGEQVPDAGAWGVWTILDAIRASLVAPSE